MHEIRFPREVDETTSETVERTPDDRRIKPFEATLGSSLETTQAVGESSEKPHESADNLENNTKITQSERGTTMSEVKLSPEMNEFSAMQETAEKIPEAVEATPETAETTPEVKETVPETADEGVEAALGYSSDYYKRKMAEAIADGNQKAYNNAKKHYGEKLAEERTSDLKK